MTHARAGIFLAFSIIGLGSLFSCQEANVKTSGPRPETPAPLPSPSPTSAEPVRVRKTAPYMVEPDANIPEIRVCIFKDVPSIKITSALAEARVTNGAGQELLHLQSGGGVQIDSSPAAPGGMTMSSIGPIAVSAGASGVNDGTIRIESPTGLPLKINGQDVAPRVTLIRTAGKTGVTAVARLDLEEYLYGVLAGEVPFDRWHPEALKAQAIASRSYAYFQTRNNAAEPYDVESTVMSQVFRAGYKDNPILSAAINSTRGLILTQNGQPISAYFHSTCGGRTENGLSVFPDQPQARALHGAACPYCTQSPNYRWKWVIGKDALTEKLRAACPKPPMGLVRSVEFADASGPIPTLTAATAVAFPESSAMRRATLVRIRHAYGTFEMTGNAFRLAVGARDLKSLLIAQAVDRVEAIEVSGGGFGHGVGMCQFGSQGMAQAGQKYTTILGMYYQGSSLTRMY
jgi:stage II sporulation protein D